MLDNLLLPVVVLGMVTFNKEAIRILRLSRGLSMEAFAAQCGGGLKRQHVFQWESGETMPSLKSLLRIVNAFGVPIEIFLSIAPTAGSSRKAVND
jgi:transcriptional regulator with XRE-family HTH domain